MTHPYYMMWSGAVPFPPRSPAMIPLEGPQNKSGEQSFDCSPLHLIRAVTRIQRQAAVIVALPSVSAASRLLRWPSLLPHHRGAASVGSASPAFAEAPAGFRVTPVRYPKVSWGAAFRPAFYPSLGDAKCMVMRSYRPNFPGGSCSQSANMILTAYEQVFNI